MINQEAKFRLLYQDKLDMHCKVYIAWFCSKGACIMKFEKILEEKEYFSVEFFDKKESSFAGPKLTYVTYLNNSRDKPKNIIYFEKEINSKSDRSKLYQEVKDNVLKLYTKITREQTSFIETVKYLFSLKQEPDDIIISGELTMRAQFLGFNNKEIDFDENEYADKQAKHILLDKKRV